MSEELKPFVVVERFCDNGAHSHWVLVERDTGIEVWDDPGSASSDGTQGGKADAPRKEIADIMNRFWEGLQTEEILSETINNLVALWPSPLEAAWNRRPPVDSVGVDRGIREKIEYFGGDFNRNFRIGAFATGEYMNHCRKCGDEFIGDKRAMMCIKCAIAALTAPADGCEGCKHNGVRDEMKPCIHCRRYEHTDHYTPPEPK